MKGVVLCLMCLLLFGVSAQAWEVINVDFGRDRTDSAETGVGALTSETGPMFWSFLNGKLSGAPVTLTDVLDAYNDATTVDIVYTKTNRDAWNADSVQNLTLTSGGAMMRGYLTTQNAVDYVTIQGLTAGDKYDLYLFGHGDNEGQNTQFTVGDVTKGSMIDVTGLTELTENAHYVIFSAVEADGAGAIEIAFENPEGGDGWGSFNGLQITPAVSIRGAAHSPVPTGTEVDSTAVSSVSWYSPEQDENGDPLNDPNIASIDGYDVYWSTTEPNYLTDEPVSELQSGLTFNPTDFALPAIAYETTYYWRVDTHITWDSNDITGSMTNVIPSAPWEFTTLAQYLEPELTFDNTITTMDLLPADLSAIVSDNSDAITSTTFKLLDDDFEFPAGANAILTDTTSDLQNPTATLTTDTAGTYKVKLTVSDGTTTVEAIAEIVVYGDACQAKKDSPGGWTADYFDTNDDCIINLIDFADMADEWLNTTIMEAPETYSGGPAFDYLVADITVDSADVYSTTDLNYVSEAPLEVNAGGPRIATHADAYGGSVIGYTDPNDFVTYEIVIPAGQGGNYTVYVANAFPSGSARSIALGTVSADGDPSNDDIYAYGSIALSDGTGWGDPGSYDQYKLDSATIALTEGTHLVRVTWINGVCNLDYMALKKE